MSRLTPHCRSARPWVHAEHLAGFVLGLALAAMAIDHGRHTAPPPLPSAQTLTQFPGP